MNFLRRAWCRIYQKTLYVAMPFMPWREPQILSGDGSFANLADFLAEKGVIRPLVVCSKTAVARHSLDVFFEGANGKLELTVYDGVLPNPTVKQVEEGRQLYIDNKCDGIVAFGGGSPMDCAKAIGARVVRPKKSVNRMKGQLKVGKKLPPFVAVPTTAGTGSECTVCAVITDTDAHDKYAINDFCLVPHYAVLDPTLTVGLPPFLTATTGMDALTHAVEAYIGKSNTRVTRRHAEEAVKLIYGNLAEATANGTNLVARQNMQHAAYLAGLAFTRAYVGYVHALAHAMGGTYGTAHGLANAVLLPRVLESYGKSAYKPLAKLARITGVANGDDGDEAAAKAFVESIDSLNAELGLPNKLTELKEEDIPALAAHADKEANPLYPVPLEMGADALADVLKSVLVSAEEN